MSDSSRQDIACPGCGKTYRWQEKFAGRKVRCKTCNGVFAMPAEPPRQADSAKRPEKRPRKADSAKRPKEPPPRVEESEDLDIHTCPSCSNPVKIGAVICVRCGYNIKEGKQIETAVGSDVPPKEGLFKKLLGRGKDKSKTEDENEDKDEAQ